MWFVYRVVGFPNPLARASLVPEPHSLVGQDEAQVPERRGPIAIFVLEAGVGLADIVQGYNVGAERTGNG